MRSPSRPAYTVGRPPLGPGLGAGRDPSLSGATRGKEGSGQGDADLSGSIDLRLIGQRLQLASGSPFRQSASADCRPPMDAGRGGRQPHVRACLWASLAKPCLHLREAQHWQGAAMPAPADGCGTAAPISTAWRQPGQAWRRVGRRSEREIARERRRSPSGRSGKAGRAARKSRAISRSSTSRACHSNLGKSWRIPGQWRGSEAQGSWPRSHLRWVRRWRRRVDRQPDALEDAAAICGGSFQRGRSKWQLYPLG